ncbi:serine threonine kinase [Fusarium agapanthi]|uniref:Serine threonine kinase n=1 Tax=Fusarium agapanthi TaxID=1803897 RepID=A0A9P5E7D7_9HYPO|nr:serine threonine kinase [Fusarium agapanthi]
MEIRRINLVDAGGLGPTPTKRREGRTQHNVTSIKLRMSMNEINSKFVLNIVECEETCELLKMSFLHLRLVSVIGKMIVPNSKALPIKTYSPFLSQFDLLFVAALRFICEASTMGPQVTSWASVACVSEVSDPETGLFQHTSFGVFDDDAFYYGQLNFRKVHVSFLDLTSALNLVPDGNVFPKRSPRDAKLAQIPEDLPANIYIKQPKVSLYHIFQAQNVLHLLPQGLVEEAQAMEFLAQHPHPNIIRYYDCKIRRGHITGLVLDRYDYDLRDYIRHQVGPLDSELVMATLESAVYHLQSLGWAYNDLNPGNILIDNIGMPILIDFGSCHEIGKKLSTSRGTEGWIDEEIKNYTTSEKRHDMYALGKIRQWLENPTLEE